MFSTRLVAVTSGTIEATIGGDRSPTFVTTHPFQAGDGEPGSLADALAGIGRTVFIAPRGMCSSSELDPSEDFIERLILDMDECRSSLGIERWIVVGQSAGGPVALAYALRFASNTAALILSCTTATHDLGAGSVYHPANPDHAVASAALAEGRRDVLAGLIAHRPEAISRRRSSSSVANQNAFLSSFRATDLAGRLEQIATPTLVIVGQHDRSMPPERGREIANRISGATLVEFEHSGHFPYDEEPERFREVVAAFVGSVKSESSTTDF
jgi:proline iminopeptidase